MIEYRFFISNSKTYKEERSYFIVHSLDELKDFDYSCYHEDDISLYVESSNRAYKWLRENYPELLI
jgi:hypothetical protein